MYEALLEYAGFHRFHHLDLRVTQKFKRVRPIASQSPKAKFETKTGQLSCSQKIFVMPSRKNTTESEQNIANPGGEELDHPPFWPLERCALIDECKPRLGPRFALRATPRKQTRAGSNSLSRLYGIKSQCFHPATVMFFSCERYGNGLLSCFGVGASFSSDHHFHSCLHAPRPFLLHLSR